MLELLAGLEPVQDGYDNERGDQGDRAESDDKLSDEEEEITQAVPFKCICAAHENHYQHHLEKAYLTLHEQDKPRILSKKICRDMVSAWETQVVGKARVYVDRCFLYK